MEPDWRRGPLPFELGIALVENPAALSKYAASEQRDKEKLISQAAACTTRTQMQALVQAFAAQ